MTDQSTPLPASPPSSSAPASPSPWALLAKGLPAAIPATSAIWVVGRPLGEALPALIKHMVLTNQWQPVAVCLLALAVLVAPVPTLALVRSVVARWLPAKKE